MSIILAIAKRAESFLKINTFTVSPYFVLAPILRALVVVLILYLISVTP